MNYPILKPFGLDAILLEWEQVISLEIHREVLLFQDYILKNYANDIIELVPAYNSLAVYLKDTVHALSFIATLKNTTIAALKIETRQKHVMYVPVCYEPVFGIDITEIANIKKCSVNEVIRLHTAPIYPVYFIGFLPGFPYLAGLDEQLYMERRAQPRAHIAGGSVAIGGTQTGIYPSDSPGGWNIIGRTPLALFSINNDAPCLLKAGDSVRFFAISEEEFNHITDQVSLGEYEVRREVFND